LAGLAEASAPVLVDAASAALAVDEVSESP
jgi:hypothetical protein